MVSQDTLVRSGLEVYRTQDVNVETTSDGDMSSEDTEKEGFVLHNGTVKEVYYVDEMTSNSFEHDYEDISSNGSVSLVTVDEARFYKGIKILLKKGYAPKKWDDLKNCLMGFITEQTYSEDGVELKVAGMTKLLEQEKQFTFTKTKRSEILKEIIESCGLKCKIDTTGLKDDVIDYTNISSSGNNSGGTSSTGSASIDEAVKNAIQGKTDDLSKAEAVDSAFKNHVFYEYYSDVHHPDLEEAWTNGHLNCADGANVLCAMFISAGLNAVIHHTPGEDGRGHYIVIVKINGKDYATDNAASSGSHTSRAFGETWGPSSGDEVGTKISE